MKPCVQTPVPTKKKKRKKERKKIKEERIVH
jgi:hypothetical protein